MSKVTGKYLIEIYDDGSFKATRLDFELPEEDDPNYIKLNDATGRIGQALKIISLTTESYLRDRGFGEKFNLKQELKKAIDQTALYFNVSIQTVNDKITRQMENKSMDEFRACVGDYLKTLDGKGKRYDKELTDKIELKQLLLRNQVSRGKKRDAMMIERFFENPEIEFKRN